MRELEQVGLWRDAPPSNPARGSGDVFAGECIFPSGRQALSEGLARAGLCRPSRVACPEWSSHCLISAVSHRATPIPMAEVIRNCIPVDAVLLYEQWGWPMSASAWEKVTDMFPNTLLIWDRVDSADFLCQTQLPTPLIVASVTSLSKLLGLSGGGILRYRGQHLRYEPAPISSLSEHVLQAAERIQNTSECKEYFQNQRQAVHPRVVDWILHNSLLRALEDESRMRQRNLRLLLGSGCARGWEPWMTRGVEEGITAGIAPLLRGEGHVNLTAATSFLRKRHRIDTTVYHFNWTGNPISPKYEPCLAFPVHGLVSDIESVLTGLEKFLRAQRTRKTD